MARISQLSKEDPKPVTTEKSDIEMQSLPLNKQRPGLPATSIPQSTQDQTFKFVSPAKPAAPVEATQQSVARWRNFTLGLIILTSIAIVIFLQILM
jgi:hypothetical protein